MFKRLVRESVTGQGHLNKDLKEIRKEPYRYLEEGQSGKCKDLEAGGFEKSKEARSCRRSGEVAELWEMR